MLTVAAILTVVERSLFEPANQQPCHLNVLKCDVMKYETRNNIGIALLVVGGLLACLSILFAKGILLVLALVVSIPMVLAGGYMMTRSFTEADVDHPDYEQYQERVKERRG